MLRKLIWSGRRRLEAPRQRSVVRRPAEWRSAGASAARSRSWKAWVPRQHSRRGLSRCVSHTASNRRAAPWRVAPSSLARVCQLVDVATVRGRRRDRPAGDARRIARRRTLSGRIGSYSVPDSAGRQLLGGSRPGCGTVHLREGCRHGCGYIKEPEMAPTLVARAGPAKGAAFPLDRTETTVGRDPANCGRAGRWIGVAPALRPPVPRRSGHDSGRRPCESQLRQRPAGIGAAAGAWGPHPDRELDVRAHLRARGHRSRAGRRGDSPRGRRTAGDDRDAPRGRVDRGAVGG